MIFCKDCKFISKKSTCAAKSFVALHPSEAQDYICGPIWYAERTLSKICEHEACFEAKIKITPMEELRTHERVKGQAQLNRNNDCKYFEPNQLPEPPQPPPARLVGEWADPRPDNETKPWYKFW